MFKNWPKIVVQIQLVLYSKMPVDINIKIVL